MKKLICCLAALCLLFCLSGCDASPKETQAPALPALTPGNHKERLNLDTNPESWMEYYLHIPENVTEGMPLIIFLHGDGQIGLIDNLKNYGLMEAARKIYGESFPFIGLTPCTRTNSWTQEDISNTLKFLIDHVAASYAIDESRIVITGHSRGAAGVWDLISRYGDFFCAAVPVSNSPESDLNPETAAKVPVRAFSGDQGWLEQQYAQEMQATVDALIAAGGDASMTILPGITHIDTDTDVYTEELFRWMLSLDEEAPAPETEPTVPSEPEPTVTAPVETTPTITESETKPVLYPLSIDAGTHRLTHTSTFYGASMDYCFFVPERAEENMPLIVYLHGDGEVNRMDSLAEIGLVHQAKAIFGEDYPFLVLAPCATRPDWTPTWTYNMVYDLVETIVREYHIDPEKIILTGHSRGAIGAWYYLNMNYYYPSFASEIQFSCAVPVSHYAAYPISPEMSAKIPILALCGDGDSTEMENKEKLQRNVDAVTAAGGTATLKILEGASHGDTATLAYTQETFEWMLAQ